MIMNILQQTHYIAMMSCFHSVKWYVQNIVLFCIISYLSK